MLDSERKYQKQKFRKESSFFPEIFALLPDSTASPTTVQRRGAQEVEDYW